MSIADPLRQLRWALGEVQRGNYNAHMQIYDASELGLLQAGFNDMVRDLAERQRLRDLFGRYVGEDVARRALERGTELGGQERDVAVLFVDLVGSTQLASTVPASEVVNLLNEFFRVIVDTVNKHGGFVNKFQGDAALAIFGAPIEHPDASGAALAASRELHDELVKVLGADRVRHRRVGRPGDRRPYRRAGPLRVHRDRRLRSTRPPGSPSWPSWRWATCSPPRSRSAARWMPRRCAGMSARSSNCAAARRPTQLARPAPVLHRALFELGLP